MSGLDRGEEVLKRIRDRIRERMRTDKEFQEKIEVISVTIVVGTGAVLSSVFWQGLTGYRRPPSPFTWNDAIFLSVVAICGCLIYYYPQIRRYLAKRKPRQ